MNVAKVNLLLVTLMSFTVGTVGCASAQSFSTTSWDSHGVLFDADQTALKSTAGEIISVKTASRSANLVTKNPTATSPTVQLAQAGFHQTLQPISKTLAAAPLATLAPGDDLLTMVEHASGVVLLDFYADWCGPCRTQGGILHEMERTAGQNGASMIKVNVDQHRGIASAFNVTSLPTLILIKDGRIIERQTGLANHQRIAALLSR